jgi:hypothetical protein
MPAASSTYHKQEFLCINSFAAKERKSGEQGPAGTRVGRTARYPEVCRMILHGGAGVAGDSLLARESWLRDPNFGVRHG